jgi:hypothetical protein
MKTTLKCVSLWQPWASFIAEGLKHVETRSWPAPASIIGTRIGIHAAKTRDGIKACRQWVDLGTVMHRIEEEHGPLPFGAIVATAVVEACVPVERLKADAFGDYTPGRYGWILTDVRKLETPIPWKGAQGLFAATIETESWGVK